MQSNDLSFPCFFFIMQTTRGQSETTISWPIIDCVSEPANVYRNHYFQISVIVITVLFFLKGKTKTRERQMIKKAKDGTLWR